MTDAEREAHEARLDKKLLEMQDRLDWIGEQAKAEPQHRDFWRFQEEACRAHFPPGSPLSRASDAITPTDVDAP